MTQFLTKSNTGNIPRELVSPHQIHGILVQVSLPLKSPAIGDHLEASPAPQLEAAQSATLFQTPSRAETTEETISFHSYTGHGDLGHSKIRAILSRHISAISGYGRSLKPS
jgi:hypothetical protein